MILYGLRLSYDKTTQNKRNQKPGTGEKYVTPKTMSFMLWNHQITQEIICQE